MIRAISTELRIRKDYLGGAPIETIYFGGGTPSLLQTGDLQSLLEIIAHVYPVQDDCEITLEANPDDLNKNKVKELKSLGINRLSIGIQSFNDEILAYLHRVHRGHDARQAFLNARETGFDNINLDLIYAIRDGYKGILEDDLKEFLELKPEHISAYSLTVEPRTVFGRWLDKHKISEVSDHEAAEQFEYIFRVLGAHDYDHYEISNYALNGKISKHNTRYWQGSPYLGVGPSAHSYQLEHREYNISNNSRYIRSLENRKIPSTMDYLSISDRINERIMTGLRTKWGCDLTGIKNEFGLDMLETNRDYIRELVNEEMIILSDGIMKLSRKGKLFADKIASDLFVTDSPV